MDAVLALIMVAAAITGLYTTFRASFWMGLFCLLLKGWPFMIIGFLFWFGFDLPRELASKD